jgi:mannose-6-phosphate isomerase-like protein (cupin superfamily)
MTTANPPFETVRLEDAQPVLAPDTSEILPLARLDGASMAHGTLGPGRVSSAVTHRTVEEIWYVLGGRAELWRKQGDREGIDEVGPGTSITLPLGTSFQFRTVGSEPFVFIMCTLPPWAGEDEAIHVPNYWPA